MRLTLIIYFLKNEASRITETRHSGNRANSLLRPNRTPYTTSNINFFSSTFHSILWLLLNADLAILFLWNLAVAFSIILLPNGLYHSGQWPLKPNGNATFPWGIRKRVTG
jgi:hypothetical protein